MKPKISIPISHLFNDPKNVKALSGLYDCLETRPFSIDCGLADQELVHADCIQPIHDLSLKDIEFLHSIKKKKKNLSLISFHCASNCTNPTVIEGIFHATDKDIYTRAEMLQNAKKNISLIKDIFGPEIKLAIENNNYYPTDAYDDVTDPEFINDIVYDNDIMFLFDNAHALVSAKNMGIDYLRYRDSLPLDKMIQIQFCEPMIPSTGIARDIHEYPSVDTINEVIDLTTRYHVQYITPEYYKDITRLCELLTTLRELYEHKPGQQDGTNYRS